MLKILVKVLQQDFQLVPQFNNTLAGHWCLRIILFHYSAHHTLLSGLHNATMWNANVRCFLVRLLQCNQFIRCHFQVGENQIFYAKQFFRFITSKCSIVMFDLLGQINFLSFAILFIRNMCCSLLMAFINTRNWVSIRSQNSATAAWQQHSNRIETIFRFGSLAKRLPSKLLNQITIVELTRRYNGNTIIMARQFIHIPYSKQSCIRQNLWESPQRVYASPP